MHMNYEVAGRDSVRGERNLHTLGMFAAGLVYELREGVGQLRDLDLPSRLGDDGVARWSELVRFAELRNKDALCQIRNCMAFHLGREEVVTRGMRRIAGEEDADGTKDEPRSLVMMSGDGRRTIDARHDIAADVVLAGIRIRPPDVPEGTPNSRRWMTGGDLEDALKEARDVHFRFARLVDEVFLDALRKAGANFDALGPMQVEKDDDDDD